LNRELRNLSKSVLFDLAVNRISHLFLRLTQSTHFLNPSVKVCPPTELPPNTVEIQNHLPFVILTIEPTRYQENILKLISNIHSSRTRIKLCNRSQIHVYQVTEREGASKQFRKLIRKVLCIVNVARMVARRGDLTLSTQLP
jgi:hypothetical protein